MITTETPKIQTPKDLLQAHIASYILTHTSILDSPTRQKMAKSLANFIVHAVAKYEAGQKEHGGNLGDRDLPLEIFNEVLDIFWYNEEQRGKK